MVVYLSQFWNRSPQGLRFFYAHLGIPVKRVVVYWGACMIEVSVLS